MFSSYAKVKDKVDTYREIFGLDFEQFEVGQIFRHRPGVTVTQQDNEEEALDTANFAMLHYDQHYASQTEWKQCLGVSTMTLQKLIGATWKTFARKKRIFLFEDIAMTHPVFDGDTLYAESEVLGVSDSAEGKQFGTVAVETRGINQRGNVVAKVCYKMDVYRRGQHPYYSQDCFETEGLEERFSAYYVESDGALKEQSGLYYEELQPAETYEHASSKIVTKEEAVRHSLHSLDWNPYYINDAFCQKYMGHDVPVNEAYLVGTVTACTTRTFGRVVANLGWTDMKVAREVMPAESFQVTSRIISKRESHSRPTQGIMTVETYVYDSKGCEVISLTRNFLIYKKGLGPYEAAGY